MNVKSSKNYFKSSGKNRSELENGEIGKSEKSSYCKGWLVEQLQFLNTTFQNLKI